MLQAEFRSTLRLVVLVDADDVSVLVIESPPIELTIVHVEAAGYLTNGARITCFDARSRQVRNRTRRGGSVRGNSRVEQARLACCYTRLTGEAGSYGAGLDNKRTSRTSEVIGIVRGIAVPVGISVRNFYRATFHHVVIDC